MGKSAQRDDALEPRHWLAAKLYLYIAKPSSLLVQSWRRGKGLTACLLYLLHACSACSHEPGPQTWAYCINGHFYAFLLFYWLWLYMFLFVCVFVWDCKDQCMCVSVCSCSTGTGHWYKYRAEAVNSVTLADVFLPNQLKWLCQVRAFLSAVDCTATKEKTASFKETFPQGQNFQCKSWNCGRFMNVLQSDGLSGSRKHINGDLS